MPKLRVGLTISGAVSLGAYEGGALAALLVAVQEMHGAVAIDAITGSSAGGITAVLTARCLTHGCDPIAAMRAAWVDLPDLKKLKTHDGRSPLSGKVLGDAACPLLTGDIPDGPPARRQTEDVRVTLTMVALGGYCYEIKTLEDKTTVDAITYLDWSDFTFTGATPDNEWRTAATAALASAANAIGFPPKLVQRSAADIQKAKRLGIQNPPDPLGVWYTDGGTIDNEPLGRLLDLLGDDDGERMLLLVHPTPTHAPPASIWVDHRAQPRWTRTAMRAQKIMGTQSIYDDLRRLEKTNTHIGWTRETARQFGTAIENVTDERERATLCKALSAIIDDIEQQHHAIDERIKRTPNADNGRSTEEASLVELLTTAIHRSSGLAGKKQVKVEIVTPDLDDSGAPADQLLAGEKLGHFFGFVDAKFRRSDFALGYRNMTTFLRDMLPKYGVGAEVDAALPVVQRRYDELGWDTERWGAASWTTLSFAERWRLARLGGHIANIVRKDIRDWNHGIPV